MNRTHCTACQSGNYDVASTWCTDDIATASAIVDIPAPFTVIIPAKSQPEFFRLDIHGVLEAHIDTKFPLAHPFTISVFDSGILTDVGISNEINQVKWFFPSNSILFVHIKGKIRTKLPVVICNADLSLCTSPFDQTTSSFTIANTPLGKLMLKKDITFIAVETGTFTTAAVWCGGQVPMVDICRTNQICNLVVLPDIELAVDSRLLNGFNNVQ